MWRVGPFWAMLGLYGVFRKAVIGALAPMPIAWGDIPPQGLRALVAIGMYARMTLIPQPAAGDIRIAPPAGPFEGRVLIGVLVVGLVLAGLVWLRSHHPSSALGLGWYAAALVPLSNALPIYRTFEVYVVERSLYPALAGWCLFVAAGVHALWTAAERRLQRPRLLAKALGGAVGLTLLAATFLKVGAWRNDVTLWTASFLSNPDSVETRLHLASALAGAGDLAQAQALLRETAELFPTDAHGAYVQGWVAEIRGDPREALRQYEQSIALGKPEDVAFRQAAVLAAQAQDWGRAGHWFAAAADRFPQAAWPQIGLGWYRQREGRTDLAQAHHARAERLEPSSPELPWFLGLLLATEGRVGEAAQAYRAALALDASFLPARVALALLLEREGRLAEAIDGWRGIAASLPAGKHRGVALEHLQRLEASLGRGVPARSR